MNMQDYKIGDIAVFKDGTEAKITSLAHVDEKLWVLWFDERVAGWILGGKDNNWLYRENGKFDTNSSGGNDIVKIIRS